MVRGTQPFARGAAAFNRSLADVVVYMGPAAHTPLHLNAARYALPAFHRRRTCGGSDRSPSSYQCSRGCAPAWRGWSCPGCRRRTSWRSARATAPVSRCRLSARARCAPAPPTGSRHRAAPCRRRASRARASVRTCAIFLRPIVLDRETLTHTSECLTSSLTRKASRYFSSKQLHLKKVLAP